MMASSVAVQGSGTTSASWLTSVGNTLAAGVGGVGGAKELVVGFPLKKTGHNITRASHQRVKCPSKTIKGNSPYKA